MNHESEPLRIEKIERPGREVYNTTRNSGPWSARLTLVLKPDGPAGRAAGIIMLRTSSPRMPMLKVGANTYLYERVHTFPDFVDFGTLPLSDAGRADAILMIHQEGGTDFRIQLSSDVPGLNLKSERGPKGDRYQVEISLVPEKIHVGSSKGSIIINTNDTEFPRVIVPVNAQFVQP